MKRLIILTILLAVCLAALFLAKPKTTTKNLTEYTESVTGVTLADLVKREEGSVTKKLSGDSANIKLRLKDGSLDETMSRFSKNGMSPAEPSERKPSGDISFKPEDAVCEYIIFAAGKNKPAEVILTSDEDDRISLFLFR